MIGLAVLVLALAQAPPPGSGAAPVPAPSAPAAPAAASNNTAGSGSDEMICKQESAAGSRIAAAKVCHTKAEWVQISAQAQDAAQRMGQSNGPH